MPVSKPIRMPARPPIAEPIKKTQFDDFDGVDTDNLRNFLVVAYGLYGLAENRITEDKADSDHDQDSGDERDELCSVITPPSILNTRSSLTFRDRSGIDY